MFYLERKEFDAIWGRALPTSDVSEGTQRVRKGIFDVEYGCEALSRIWLRDVVHTAVALKLQEEYAFHFAVMISSNAVRGSAVPTAVSWCS